MISCFSELFLDFLEFKLLSQLLYLVHEHDFLLSFVKMALLNVMKLGLRDLELVLQSFLLLLEVLVVLTVALHELFNVV